MRGHIRERSPGRWAIVIDGRDVNGKRKRRWYSFAGTKRQAQLETARIIAEAQKSGGTVAPERLTVTDYLEQWLRHIRSNVSPKSYERYASIIRANIIPALGNVRLSKLQPLAISGAYSDALARLAPRTVNHMHVVLAELSSRRSGGGCCRGTPATTSTRPRSSGAK
jgi:hypothetical protein